MENEKFSVVLPVHNEEETLPYTLPSLKRLNPAEIVVVFDRCTDKTEQVVDQFLNGVKIRKIHNGEKSGWKSHVSYLYDQGIRNAENNTILITQADIYLDPRIKEEIESFNKGLKSFRTLFPLRPIRCAIHTVISILVTNLSKSTSFSGVFAIDKETYLHNPPHPEEPLGLDSYLFSKVKKQIFVKTRCVNLRPWTEGRHYWLGREKARAGKSLLKVLGFSMLRLMPRVFVSYLHERRLLKNV